MAPVLLIVLSACLAHTNSLPADSYRGTGWGSNPASIEVDITGSVLTTTLGITGNAGAEQQVTESAIGSIDIPALVNSTSGTLGEVLQEGEITQVASANTGEGSASSASLVHGNSGGLGDDFLAASLSAGELVAVQNSGTTYVAPGGGVILVDSSSLNNISSKRD